MKNIKVKDKLYELRNLLNSIITYENLQSEKVLKISKELDILIFNSYLGNKKGRQENNI